MRARLRGHQWHVPALLRFEMANVCLIKIGNLPIQRDALLAQHTNSLFIPIVDHAIDQEESLHLAERHRLSTYDASYLWLARHLGAELVTLDKTLAKAAASE